jgi:flagellar biosynthesis/type III secretory pathway chaperone
MRSSTVEVSPLIETLIEVLAQEHAALESFLGLLRLEQDAIRTLSSSAMAEVTAQKLTQLEAIRVLEQKRSEVVGRLAGEWGVSDGELTIRAIADRVGALEAGAVLRMQDQLNRTIVAIGEASEFNGSLIANSLDCFQQLLSACRLPEQPLLYSATGAWQPTQTSGQAVVEGRG